MPLRNSTRTINASVFLGGLFLIPGIIGPAWSAITISTAPTQKMACTNNVCSPTSKNAVFNVSDLEGLLANGNVTITTYAANGKQASDIVVDSSISWSSSAILTLTALGSVTVDAPVSVNGVSGISINDGGWDQFVVRSAGNVEFQDTSSSLVINGVAYTLGNSISALANAIAANPTGAFALANSYDASGDGTYPNAPIGFLNGPFEGLGNTISNLTIADSVDGYAGFFGVLYLNGSVNNLTFANADVSATFTLGGDDAGILVGQNDGIITNCIISGGSVTVQNASTGAAAGGIAGSSSLGLIQYSATSATVTATNNDFNEVGGIVGWQNDWGEVFSSYATGDVSADGSMDYHNSGVGGLVGLVDGTVISNSYATGSVTGTGAIDTGGLFGLGYAENSYSLGSVSGSAPPSCTGGLAGNGSATKSYWDTGTSGQSQGTGCGSEKGITSLTSQQFRSGLPKGFSKKIWGENSNINGGFPYLLANPPQ